jgi:hypothetical protein
MDDSATKQKLLSREVASTQKLKHFSTENRDQALDTPAVMALFQTQNVASLKAMNQQPHPQANTTLPPLRENSSAHHSQQQQNL